MLSRTAIVLGLALGAGVASAGEQWIPDVSRDPMSDKVVVRLMARAQEDNAALSFSCRGGTFYMLLILDEATPSFHQVVNYGKSVSVGGRWRIDAEKADEMTYWSLRSQPNVLEPHSMFAKDAKKFLRKLEGRRRVMFEVAGVPGVLTFDLLGLDTKALAACYRPQD